MFKKISLASVMVFVLIVTGCAGSFLTSTWNNGSEKKSYDQIVVVVKSRSQVIRNQFEQQITEQLSVAGINAMTSESLVPQSAIDNDPTEQELENLKLSLLDAGVDGVIITSLIDQEDYVEVIPGSISPYPYYRGGYGRYWGHYPVNYWEPDRVVSGINYYLESALYDISIEGTDNLHWVGNFKLNNPGSVESWSGKYASELAKALIDEKKGPVIVAM